MWKYQALSEIIATFLWKYYQFGKRRKVILSTKLLYDCAVMFAQIVYKLLKIEWIKSDISISFPKAHIKQNLVTKYMPFTVYVKRVFLN